MIAPVDFLRLVSDAPAHDPMHPEDLRPDTYQTRAADQDLLPWADPYIASLIREAQLEEAAAATPELLTVRVHSFSRNVVLVG